MKLVFIILVFTRLRFNDPSGIVFQDEFMHIVFLEDLHFSTSVMVALDRLYSVWNLSTALLSVDTMREQNTLTDAMIRDMFTDAMDVIRQDGDYMERIEMDMRRECLLCPWTGSMLVLEKHMKQEHMHHIVTHRSNEWTITYTLGSLVQQKKWLYQLVQHESLLYMISAKYDVEEDMLLATIHIVTTEEYIITKSGEITFFDTITHTPFKWNGPIEELPYTMPSPKDMNCFKLKLSLINLLPDKARHILNRLKFRKTPIKVGITQSVLNKIDINLCIKLRENEINWLC